MLQIARKGAADEKQAEHSIYHIENSFRWTTIFNFVNN